LRATSYRYILNYRCVPEAVRPHSDEAVIMEDK